MKKWSFCIFLFCAFSTVFSSKNILLLNSYHSGYSWTDEITEGIKKTITSDKEIDLFIEYLDSKRFTQNTKDSGFYNFLLDKYRYLKVDVLITSDNDALDFVIQNKLNKLWDIPVVFCGISNYTDYDIQHNNLWGVIESDDWYPILQMLNSVFNNSIEKFYFIIENSVTGKIRKGIFEDAFKKLGRNYSVNYIETFHVDSVFEQIRQIDGNSLIIYQGIGFDSYGNPVNPENFALKLVNNAEVPVFSTYANVIGHGAIGGYVRSGKIQGNVSAGIAMKLIRNRNIGNIPGITVPEGQYIFDYRAIKKFNLNSKNLPKKAFVLNKPDSILKNYKKEVFSAISIIVFLVFIIIFQRVNVLRRKRAERKIMEIEEKFREFAEMLPQTVFECDTKGNFTFVNNHGLDFFGYTKEELQKGINILHVFSQDDHIRITHNLEKIQKNEHVRQCNIYHAVRKDGSEFPFEVHINLIMENESVKGIRGIGIDVTRQKSFEEQLITARKKAEEADKLKSTFLANMSHEIRTPLNSIVGFSYLLAERNLKEEEINRMANFIKSSSDHLLMLVNDIIDISKIESGQLSIHPKEFDINELMNELALFVEKEKLVSDKKHLDIIYEIYSKNEEILVHSDSLRVKQILLNLLSNALKFTETGSIHFGYTLQNSSILFYIKDTGIGISKELKARLFERFAKDYDTKDKIYPGFGLGLSISKQLSELLNGKLWFEDNPEGGSVFYLSLPINMH